ncbi:hypothetical protein [Streptomyces muensis]|uniref:hypothetical protein n=1 Tax=Streptomyces muensis TaxID=1077944 RepID=UPI0027E2C6DA|nr:hypothetical protein [Streptomyces muensis]
MTAALRPVHPDRLESGEGIRRTGSGVALADIVAGRLLSVPDDPGGPLRTVTRLPVPLGAVAPLAGHVGAWIAAAGTGICLLRSDGTVARTPRLPARQPAGGCLADDALFVTSACVGLPVPGTQTPACRLDNAPHPSTTGDPV